MIYNEQDTRQNILDGARILYDAVRVTLGPQGRNVIVKNKFGEFKITHDGVTVARSIKTEDEPWAIGVDLFRTASLKLEELGDATTTATVFGCDLYFELSKLVDDGMNPMVIKREIDTYVDFLLAEVDKQTKQIGKTQNELFEVATISVGGDKELAKVITDVMIKAGLDSLIAVEKSTSSETTGIVAEGYTFSNGFLNQHMITDPKTHSAIFEKPLIVYVTEIPDVEAMVALVGGAYETGHKEVLFVVGSIKNEEAVDFVTLNAAKGAHLALVKAPGLDMNEKRERMLDMASLTGGGVIDTDIDDWQQYLAAANFGKAKKVVIKSTDTLIVADQTDDSEERIESIRKLIKDEKDDVETLKLNERLAALTGGVGVIRVGGANDQSISEKKDRVDDAIGAVRVAMQGGVVAGGGITLLEMSEDLFDKLGGKVNIKICNAVKWALEMPNKVLLENSGIDIIKLDGAKSGEGIDVTTGERVNMIDAGIIDPALITKEVIRQAFAVAGDALTAGGAIVDPKVSQEQLMKMMEAGK